MDVSILQHSVEDFRSHANRERIPTQIYLDSSQACQVIGDEIIYQINQSLSLKFLKKELTTLLKSYIKEIMKNINQLETVLLTQL